MPNLLDPFAPNLRTNPDDLALWVEGEELSYRELAEQFIPVANWINSVSQRPNPRIGILSTRSLSAYLGILGAAWAGAAYVPLSTKAPARYLNEILRSAHIDGLIVDETGLEIIATGQLTQLPEAILSPVFVPENSPPTELALGVNLPEPSLWEPATSAFSDISYVMFTSGTTGKPKGIEVNLENILHLLKVLQNRYLYDSKDRLSQAFELTFDVSVFDIFMALRSGASLHVIPDHQRPAPSRFIQQQQLTSWFSVPSVIGMLKQMKLLQSGSFPSLRLSLFAGEALPEESARTWQKAATNSRVENLYGPTEATVVCLLQDCSDPHAITQERGTITIGQPLEGLHAAIVDENGHFLPVGKRGELAIHGPQVTSGYLDNPELTAKRFPFLAHSETGHSRWYLTGDLASRDEEGRYHFFGRIDNQVKMRGHRVELDEVEHHLREVSSCDNAVVVFLDHCDLWKQEIVGVVLTGSLDTGEIRKLMGERLPPHMVPKKIVVCSELPLNSSGKLDRNALVRNLKANRVDTP